MEQAAGGERGGGSHVCVMAEREVERVVRWVERGESEIEGG